MRRLSPAKGTIFHRCESRPTIGAGCLVTVLLLLANVAAAAPCTSAQHRAFDFWLGDWNVYKSDGSLAGQNRIALVEQGCVLHEQYETAKGYSGQSFTLYDASRDRWHQSWVDNQGGLLLLDGGIADSKMVLEGFTQSAQGEQRNRITWSKESAGQVRQHWQVKQGETWHTVFDGLYKPRPRSPESVPPSN